MIILFNYILHIYIFFLNIYLYIFNFKIYCCNIYIYISTCIWPPLLLTPPPPILLLTTTTDPHYYWPPPPPLHVTGENCESMIDPCESQPCLYGGVCNSRLTSSNTLEVTCTCTEPTSGEYCESYDNDEGTVARAYAAI